MSIKLDWQEMIEDLEMKFEDFFDNLKEDQQEVIISQFKDLLGYFDEFVDENEFEKFE